MKTRFGLMCFVLLMLTGCKCTSDGPVLKLSGEQTVEPRHLAGFERVEVIGSPTVRYMQADTTSVSVCGPKELVSEIITEVSGGKLTIRNRGKMGLVNFRFNDDDKLYVAVSSPDIIGVEVSGSGDFISQHHIDTDQLNVRLKGSGNVSFSDVICDRCDIELIGSGDIDFERLDTRRTSASLVGSGDIDINQFRVLQTDLLLRGSGDIDVSFQDDCGAVSAVLQGSGDISLKGRVRQLHQSKQGSGTIDTSDLSHP